MDKPDQQDIQQSNKALENACAVLITNLRETGGGAFSIPTAPIYVGGADLQYYAALENYHAQLAAMLGKQNKSSRPSSATATTPARSAATEATTTSVSSASASAPTALTADEVKALSWTERVQYAGGKLSAEQLRARIAERANAKADKSKTPTALERVLQSRGVKSVQALAELPARNLD